MADAADARVEVPTDSDRTLEHRPLGGLALLSCDGGAVEIARLDVEGRIVASMLCGLDELLALVAEADEWKAAGAGQ